MAGEKKRSCSLRGGARRPRGAMSSAASSHARTAAIAAASIVGASITIVLLQAGLIARRIPRLPPAPGETRGRARSVGGGGDAGDEADVAPEPALSLLVFGDSVACGVGCPSNELAFAGATARALAAAVGRDVEWTVLAESGYNAAQMELELLPRLRPHACMGAAAAEKWDVVVVSVGVNALLELQPPRAYGADLHSMLAALHAVAGEEAVVVVAGMPPLQVFPAVPWPLSAVVGALGGAIDTAAQAVCLFGLPEHRKSSGELPLLAHAKLSPEKLADTLTRAQTGEFTSSAFFALDGFHPNVRGSAEFYAPPFAAAAAEQLAGGFERQREEKARVEQHKAAQRALALRRRQKKEARKQAWAKGSRKGQGNPTGPVLQQKQKQPQGLAEKKPDVQQLNIEVPTAAENGEDSQWASPGIEKSLVELMAEEKALQAADKRRDSL